MSITIPLRKIWQKHCQKSTCFKNTFNSGKSDIFTTNSSISSENKVLKSDGLSNFHNIIAIVIN